MGTIIAWPVIPRPTAFRANQPDSAPVSAAEASQDGGSHTGLEFLNASIDVNGHKRIFLDPTAVRLVHMAGDARKPLWLRLTLLRKAGEAEDLAHFPGCGAIIKGHALSTPPEPEPEPDPGPGLGTTLWRDRPSGSLFVAALIATFFWFLFLGLGLLLIP